MCLLSDQSPENVNLALPECFLAGVGFCCESCVEEGCDECGPEYCNGQGTRSVMRTLRSGEGAGASQRTGDES